MAICWLNGASECYKMPFVPAVADYRVLYTGREIRDGKGNDTRKLDRGIKS